MKTIKKFVLTIVLAIIFIFQAKTQGVNIGFGAGTELPRLELGYSIKEKINFGAYFSPGWKLTLNTPTSFGIFGRYTFKKNTLFDNQFITSFIRPYLGVNVGILHRAAYEDYFSLNSGGTVPAKTQIGGSVNGGAEILYGKKASYGSFFELHVGQNSNYFQSLTNSFNSALGGTTNSSDKIASVWGFLVGFRFYFSKS
jgi:hypothetical protein